MTYFGMHFGMWALFAPSLQKQLTAIAEFRTIEGATEYLQIMSCVSTGRKHGHNGYNVIMNLIHGSLEFMTAV